MYVNMKEQKSNMEERNNIGRRKKENSKPCIPLSMETTYSIKVLYSEEKSRRYEYTEIKRAYTVVFSGGVVSGGLGYFSSGVCVITSESATHFSSNFITGTLPSALIFKNLFQQNK